jgi:hypothetical protein
MIAEHSLHDKKTKKGKPKADGGISPLAGP